VISIAQDYGKVNALAARIVILTSYAEDEVLLDTIGVGVESYVFEQIGSDDLGQALLCEGAGFMSSMKTERGPTWAPFILPRVSFGKRRSALKSVIVLPVSRLR